MLIVKLMKLMTTEYHKHPYRRLSSANRGQFKLEVEVCILFGCSCWNFCLQKQVYQVACIMCDCHTFFPNTYLRTHCKILNIIRTFSKNEKRFLFNIVLHNFVSIFNV